MTGAELAAKANMRPAQLSAVERGHNVEIRFYDMAARALNYRGAVDLFTSGGDDLTRKMLRLWRALPDEEARKDVLQQLKNWNDRDEE